MEYVEPIKDKKKLQAMALYLKGKKYRDYVLFILGINSALRISDLLSLKVSDVRRKTRIILREQKTGKIKDFPINTFCKSVLKEYIHDMPDESPLFPSQKGTNSISRIQAYRIIREAATAVGIKEKVGTHTLRKTFAYWVYRQEDYDIGLLQCLLNHSSSAVTLRYIGVTRDRLDAVYQKNILGD